MKQGQTNKNDTIEPEICQILYHHGYIAGMMLGSGSFGKCFAVNSIKYSCDFACKVTDISTKDDRKKASFLREVECLKKLDGPHIIKTYDYFEDGKYAFIVLDLCSNGSLQDIINKKAELKPEQIRTLMKQVLIALSFCHMKGIAHHDIKPSNILIDSFSRLQLCDFGLAKEYTRDQLCTDYFGSAAFMSPEVIQSMPYDPVKADIWSFGVSFFYFISHTLPYNGTTKQEIKTFQQMGFPSLAKNVPDDIKNIIRSCLTLRESMRPTTHELLNMLTPGMGIPKSIEIHPHSKSVSNMRRYTKSLFKLGNYHHQLDV